MKRSEILFPPQESKATLSRFHQGEASFASKVEDKIVLPEESQAPVSTMEFKKKKFCPPSFLKVEQQTVTPFSELKTQSSTDDLLIRRSKGKKLREITIEDF